MLTLRVCCCRGANIATFSAVKEGEISDNSVDGVSNSGLFRAEAAQMRGNRIDGYVTAPIMYRSIV